MTIQASSVMTTAVVTASPEMTLGALAWRMLEQGVSALPVVDAQLRPLGVVSEGDVLRHFSAAFQSKRAQWLRHMAESETLSPDFLAAIGLDQGLARELMRRPAITVTEDAALAEIGEVMVEQNVKRVLIVRGGVLVGIVSRADLVWAIVENLQDLLEPTN